MPSQLVMISWNDGDKPFPVDPGYGVSAPPMRPDNSLPSNGGAITLPVFPFDPTVGIDNSLPTTPGTPSNPIVMPPTVWPPRPGNRFVIKWLACQGLILVPDNSLPPTAEPK